MTPNEKVLADALRERMANPETVLHRITRVAVERSRVHGTKLPPKVEKAAKRMGLL